YLMDLVVVRRCVAAQEGHIPTPVVPETVVIANDDRCGMEVPDEEIFNIRGGGKPGKFRRKRRYRHMLDSCCGDQLQLVRQRSQDLDRAARLQHLAGVRLEGDHHALAANSRRMPFYLVQNKPVAKMYSIECTDSNNRFSQLKAGRHARIINGH